MIQSGSSCPVKLLTTLTSARPFHKRIQLVNQGDFLFVNEPIKRGKQVSAVLAGSTGSSKGPMKIIRDH